MDGVKSRPHSKSKPSPQDEAGVRRHTTQELRIEEEIEAEEGSIDH